MIKTFAIPDMYGASVAISIVRYAGDSMTREGASILRLNPGQPPSWEPIEEDRYPIEPTLRLGFYESLSLGDALAELGGAIPELRALRADYVDERRRVDRMIDALIEAAKP